MFSKRAICQPHSHNLLVYRPLSPPICCQWGFHRLLLHRTRNCRSVSSYAQTLWFHVFPPSRMEIRIRVNVTRGPVQDVMFPTDPWTPAPRVQGDNTRQGTSWPPEVVQIVRPFGFFFFSHRSVRQPSRAAMTQFLAFLLARSDAGTETPNLCLKVPYRSTIWCIWTSRPGPQLRRHWESRRIKKTRIGW